VILPRNEPYLNLVLTRFPGISLELSYWRPRK
jgi:hypothetical protein